jgi:hypothetical protein
MVTKGGIEKLAKTQTNLRFPKHTGLTIHWKVLEEHFLMLPLVYFRGREGTHFLKFSKNTFRP